MSLSKEIFLTIQDYSMTLTGNLNFYVNDCLDLIFNINKWGVDNARGSREGNAFDLSDITAELYVEHPNLMDTIEAAIIKDNKIIFRLTKKQTAYVGEGRMQIRLVDSDGCELKLPPFPYTVQSTIHEIADINPSGEIVLASNEGKVIMFEDRKFVTPNPKADPNQNPNVVKITDLPEMTELRNQDYVIVSSDGITKRALVPTIKPGENLALVKTIAERDALKDIKNGKMCYVEEDKVYYARRDDEWVVFQSGTGNGPGGGTAVGTITSKLDGTTQSISVGQSLTVDINFTTPNVGAGTLHIMSDGVEIKTQSVGMGPNKVVIDLSKGSYDLQLYVVDRGGVYTNTVLITVHCGGLDISSTFDDTKNYTVGTPIKFSYKIDTISNDSIKTHFKIDSKDYEVDSKKGHNTYNIPTLTAGPHKMEVYSTSGSFTSNKLKYTIMMLDSGSLFVSPQFDQTTAEQGDQLIIEYRVSMMNVNEFNVQYLVNSEPYKEGKAFNGTNMFIISDLPMGKNTVTIKVSTLDSSQSAEIHIPIEIIESSYKMIEPVTADLIAWFNAYGLSNQDKNRTTWVDSSGSGVVAELINMNYNTNGWIDNGLRLNGSAYAKLNIKPFMENAPTGLTIDVEFKTEDIGNEAARVIDCMTKLTSKVGCYVDTNKAVIKSNGHEIEAEFAQNEKTRVTYVIDRFEKLVKIYINGVMTSAALLNDKDGGSLESFEHGECIYLNSEKGESNFGDCVIYNVRVYDRPLESKEILQNHISDIKDKEEQRKKHDFNYKNTIPTMRFHGDISEMSKEHKVPLRIQYISTNEEKYGQSFDLENCLVQHQGTSSLQYDVKNYKIRLKDAKGNEFKRPLRAGMIPEDKFTLKADYMESSHANNTGSAKIVNRYLYTSKLPPQQDNDKVVRAIDGFPIKLYINKDLIGIYNFNLDKGCNKSFGLDLEAYPECLSYEVKANSDTTAGAFFKWTPATGKTELEYLQKDFELRFPDEEEFGKEYGYIEKLKPLIDWVSDATDDEFKMNFDKHFDREYTFKYYLFVLVFGMVDNLGKNMMLNTWDGKKWYPCFYDLDSCLALDNSGYIRFDVDIEMVAGTYNTSTSQLWTKVARVFKTELAEMYKQMRRGTFKESNIFDVLIGEQIDQIPESLYNQDSEEKYLRFASSYIHMLHGSRREHMKKWITQRLLYLDSKFGYDTPIKESITIRANKQGEVYFDIQTYSPMFVKIVWANGEEENVKIPRNEAVRCSHVLKTGTDQEILIYGARHLKDIGDITNMKPSSMMIKNASKLTRLVCTNSPKLEALGMGGVSTDGVSYNLKNLQLLDLSGCTNLGTAAGNDSLDLSYCENLKTLKIPETSFKSIIFHPKGGNLVELYLSNSITSLHLTNQYSLKKVLFPSTKHQYMALRDTYEKGSKIAQLSIINCKNLTHLGYDVSFLDFNSLNNYRGIGINSQPDDFDISKDEYKQAYSMTVFGRLVSLSIDNSLLDYKYCCVSASPSLRKVTFKNMPKLKGLMLTGNRAYTSNTGNDYTRHNFEGTPNFENIEVVECSNFDTLVVQKPTTWLGLSHSYKFTDNFTWDLSHLKLKKFICNIGLQNLKKLILPATIEEFSHSNTELVSSGKNHTDGSSYKYTAKDSPLETIIIAGQGNDENFLGVDLNKPLKNVNLAGLTQNVKIIKNVNCKAVDLIPKMASPHYTGQKFENVLIDLNQYKETSLINLFKNVDMTNIRVVLENSLTTKNMNYEHMFYQAKKVSWANLQWVKKLPQGRVYQTFYKCEADRLEIGNMIGTATTDLVQCFSYMPNINYLDVTGANTSSVTSARHAFSSNGKLRQLIGLETLDFSKVTDAYEFLAVNPVLENIPLQIMSNFTSVSELNRFFLNNESICGMDRPVKIPDSVTVINDLLGEKYNKESITDTLTFEFGQSSKIKQITSIGHMDYPVKHIRFLNMPPVDTCNFILNGNGSGLNTSIQSISGINASNIKGTCYPLTYNYNIVHFHYPTFTTLSFEGEINCSELYIANLYYLDVDCLNRIIKQLKNRSTETRGVLNVGIENKKKLTSDMIEIAQNKNWSVVV